MLNHSLGSGPRRTRRFAIAAVAIAVLGAPVMGSAPAYAHELRTAGGVVRVKPSKRPQKIVLPPAYADVLHGMLHMKDDNSPVARMNLRALLRVPPPVLKRLKGAGVLIFISARPVPENADLGSMRGVNARGHGDETWDQIEGTYVPDKKYIVAGGVPGMDGSSGSSLPHELGHAVAHTLGYLNSRELIDAHKRVFGHLEAYEQQGGPGAEAGRDEMYAETVGVLIDGFRGKAIRRTDARFVRWLEVSLGLGR